MHADGATREANTYYHLQIARATIRPGKDVSVLGRLVEPSFGARAPGQTRVLVPLRAFVVGLFLVFSFLGVFGGWRPLLIFAVVLIPVGALALDAVNFLVRDRPSAEIKLYAVAFPAHIALISLAAATDPSPHSPIPGLTLATIIAAAAPFKPRYIIALGVLAVAGASAADIVRNWDATGVSHWPLLLTVAILCFGTGFAAETAGAAEALRKDLSSAEERGRHQSDSLRLALLQAQQSEARLRAFSDYAPAAFVLLDRTGKPIFANQHVEETIGMTAEQLADRHERSRKLSSPDRDQFRAALSAALAGEATPLEFALLSGRRISGMFFPFAEGAGAILFDVTEERLITEQMARIQQMETLGTLAGGIAHDFNNLLTTILGNVHLARIGLADHSPLTPLLDDARVAGERGAELVRRLLDYSRPAVEHSERISLAALIEETLNLARPGLTPQVEVSVHAPDPALAVLGNFGSLQQVLLNLLINARDAVPGGGTITVTCTAVGPLDVPLAPGHTAPNGYLSLSVRDTGTGITPEALPRIFDPFFTTKDVGKGTGLGLSTSVSIVRAHGGLLDVQTELGQGSTFRILLPAASEIAAGSSGLERPDVVAYTAASG